MTSPFMEAKDKISCTYAMFSFPFLWIVSTCIMYEKQASLSSVQWKCSILVNGIRKGKILMAGWEAVETNAQCSQRDIMFGVGLTHAERLSPWNLMVMCAADVLRHHLRYLHNQFNMWLIKPAKSRWQYRINMITSLTHHWGVDLLALKNYQGLTVRDNVTADMACVILKSYKQK